MSLFTGIIIYFLVWWVTIFTVLNIGHRTADNPETGHAASAPVQFNLGKKILLNSVIAGVVWLIIWVVITYGGFSFTEAVASWQ
jgi:predicted secreted protein